MSSLKVSWILGDLKHLDKKREAYWVGKKGLSKEKIYCYVYTLTFDKNAVLRHWERELCQVPTPPNIFEQELSGKLRLPPNAHLEIPA